MSETIDVPVRDDSIRLGQLLKLSGVVDDGAQARRMIEAGEVSVDGEVDRRRGRQVVVGSTVAFGDVTLQVVPAEG